MLLDPWGSVPKVQRFKLSDEAFYDRRHQMVFKALMAMASEGRPVDALTFRERLKDNGLLDKAGGDEFLAKLMDPSLVPGHVEHYADIVRQKWIKRQVLSICEDVIREAYVSPDGGDELLKSVPERFMGIIDEAVREQGLPEAIDQMMAEFEAAAKGERKLYGLPLPWTGLNDAMCGIPAGFGFIAARPSQGKTTLEDVVFSHWAAQGIPVGRITMDMTKARLLQRAASRTAGVSLPKIKKGYVKHRSKQWDSIAEEARRMKTWPMYINDKDRNLSAICTWIRMVVIKHKVRAVSIDYIQQVMTGGKIDSEENMRITVVSGALKALANELGIAIIALSQLSRGSDKDKRTPTMADLRGSGSLEQDAQWIWMLYKDKDVEESKTLRPVWIDIAKSQDGETGGFPFWMYPNYFSFEPAQPGYTAQGDEIPFWDLAERKMDQAKAARAEEVVVEI
jgi:replicative DNA helicase